MQEMTPLNAFSSAYSISSASLITVISMLKGMLLLVMFKNKKKLFKLDKLSKGFQRTTWDITAYW